MPALTTGTMVQELDHARELIPRLEARVAELEESERRRLSVDHYLNNLRQELLFAASDPDFTTAQLGAVALEALDVVVATRALIEERHDEPPAEAEEVAA